MPRRAPADGTQGRCKHLGALWRGGRMHASGAVFVWSPTFQGSRRAVVHRNRGRLAADVSHSAMTVCLRAARRVWQADAIGDATLQFHIYALNESSSQEEVDRARIRAYAQLSGGRAGGCAEWDGQRSEGGGGGSAHQ